MALKIKIPGGSKGAPPWRLFPRSYSISLGQMRKHLRGPGQATYDFDGGQPGLLRVKKEGGPQAKLSIHMSAHKERILQKRRFMRGHPLLPLAAKVGKNAPGGEPPALQIAGRFSFYENRRKLQRGGPGLPGVWVIIVL